jgi:hypothetical protein
MDHNYTEEYEAAIELEENIANHAAEGCRTCQELMAEYMASGLPEREGS